MREDAARALIEETFDQPYDRDRFKGFASNLVSGYEARHKAGIVPDSFKSHIDGVYRLGKIADTDRHEIDIVEVRLKRTTSVHRARTMQRNFVSRYLKGRDKDAALVAFVAADDDSWRFSLVTQELQLIEDLKGRVKVKAIPTPAKRLSFRLGGGERTHTAKRQLLPVLIDDARPTLDILRKTFSVETVSREFFEKYRELFYRAVEVLEAFLDSNEKVAEHFGDRGIEASDFAKRLLGQIVFLYFLQKKGWLGVPVDGAWGEGDRDFMRTLFKRAIENNVNFFDGFLEHLFYDALAVDNSPENHFHDRFRCRLPFLNGGLFEPYNDYQWRGTEILLDNALFSNDNTTAEGDSGDGILDIFDRYNFTVAEDEPLEKEVAVDPEMLGKVFENLLEVKDRRSSGTYYTPREIVHYMCQESLIAYLARQAPAVPTDDIETLIRYGELFLETDAEVAARKRGAEGPDGDKSERCGQYLLPDTVCDAAEDLDEALATVRVCDPAIGSGAFPVGMMTEIVRARTVLGQYLGREETPYRLKYETIHESLYGVDINPGAIEIAKLRLWLSLVVDEEAYDDVQPLPNLDYRIMQGNSLLETYEGIRLFDDSILNTELVTQDRESLKERLKIRQGELTAEITALANQPLDARHRARRKEIEGEARKTVKALKELESAETDGLPPMDLLDSVNAAVRWDQELRVLHEAYFSETDRRRKMDLRKEIEDMEWRLIEESLKDQGKEHRLAEFERYRRTKTRPFFLWRLHFSEVFHPQSGDDEGMFDSPHDGGFDIVIANPPYIKEYTDRSAFDGLRSSPYYRGKMDIWYFFACMSFDLLSRSGVQCFIAQNNWVTSAGASKLRRKIADECKVLSFVDFGAAMVFENASIQTMSYVIDKDGSHDFFDVQYRRLEDKSADAESIERFLAEKSVGDVGSAFLSRLWRKEIRDSIISFVPAHIDEVLRKIEKNGSYKLKKTEILQGVVAPQDKVNKKHIEKLGFGEIGDGIFVLSEDEASVFPDSERNILRPYYTSKEIGRYGKKVEHEAWLIYLGSDADRVIQDYPNVQSHLDQYGEIITSDNAPYGLHRARKEKFFSGNSIVSLRKTARPNFSFADYPCYVSQSYCTIQTDRFDLKYLVGLFNSKAIEFWFRCRGKMQGNNYQIDGEPLLRVPIYWDRTADFSKIIKKVDLLIRKIGSRQDADVSALEAEIDQLVYELYGLTDEEIALIESSLTNGAR